MAAGPLAFPSGSLDAEGIAHMRSLLAKATPEEAELLLRLSSSLVPDVHARSPAQAGSRGESSGSDDEVVTINVGGTVFTTLRSSLTRFPGSRLEAMLSGRWRVARDEAGRVFVDRSPAHFQAVLDFLRDPGAGFSLPDADVMPVLEELDWYGLRHVAAPDPFPGSDVLGGSRGFDVARMVHDAFPAAGGTQWEAAFTSARDGFSPAAFHAACDAAPFSVVAVRTTLGTVFGGFMDAPWSPDAEMNMAKSRAFLFVLETLHGPARLCLRAGADPAGLCLMRQDVAYGPLFGVFEGPSGRPVNALGAMVKLRPSAAAVHIGTEGCCFERPAGWTDARLLTGSAVGVVSLEAVEAWIPAVKRDGSGSPSSSSGGAASAAASAAPGAAHLHVSHGPPGRAPQLSSPDPAVSKP